LAIVQHKFLNTTDSGVGIKDPKVLQQLKQLKFWKKIRNMHHKISRTLSPQTQLGIDYIDVPDVSTLGPNLGYPTQPKTWRGPWTTLRDPAKIANEIKKANIAQYHQAYHTPFGSGPLAETLGRQGIDSAAQSLLKGDITSLPTRDLFPEMCRILDTLIRPYPNLSTDTPTDITAEEFINAYKHVNEQTTTSPSGHHVDHYKAIVDNPTIVDGTAQARFCT
jgi:hypothetical protein